MACGFPHSRYPSGRNAARLPDSLAILNRSLPALLRRFPLLLPRTISAPRAKNPLLQTKFFHDALSQCQSSSVEDRANLRDAAESASIAYEFLRRWAPPQHFPTEN